MFPKIGDIYTHYKNPDKQYEIVCVGKFKETKEDMIAYRALYPVVDLGEEFSKDPVFFRTLTDFMAVLPDGGRRFIRQEKK